jgi:hypothetical protein
MKANNTNTRSDDDGEKNNEKMKIIILLTKYLNIQLGNGGS